jgi:tetratricopeptide (TPR) repeat protein
MTLRTALAFTAVALLACKRDPSIVHREQADDLLQRSDFTGAATEYEKSLATDPKQDKVWEKLAFCRVKTGEKDLAAETLARLADLKTSPAQKAEVLRNAAGIFLQTPDQAKAEKYLIETVRLEPRDESSLTWLGELASQKGGARLELATGVPEELDKAIGYYGQLLALRSDNKGAHANRRIAATKYIGWLADEKYRQQKALQKAGKDATAAAAARERLAQIDAKTAELKRLVDESNARLSPQKKASAM